MPGSRYTIDISTTGNARSGLEQIGFAVGKAVGQLDRLVSAAGKASGQMGKIGGAQMGQSLMEMGQMMDRAAESFLNISTKIVDKGSAFVQSIIGDAAAFEDTQSSLKYAFGKDWENIFSKVKQESAKLTFTLDEVGNLAAQLGRMKINPFGTTGEDLNVFRSKTGENISALEVLQDVSDATGRRTEQIMFSMRNALAGNFRSLKEAVDMPVESFKRIEKAVKDAKTPQEKYNAVIKELGEYFGGAGRAKAENWSKAIAQIPDLLQQFRAGIGAEGLKVLTKAVFEFIDAFKGIIQDKEAMKALSDAFVMVAQVMAFGIRMAIGFAQSLSNIVKQMPWLPMLIAGLAVATALFTAAIGVALGLAAAIAAVAGAIAVVGFPVILGALAAALVLIPIFIGLLGGIIGLVVGVGQAVSNSFGGIGQKFEAMKVLFTALLEFMGSFSGGVGEISAETHAKIQEMGLEDVANAVLLLGKRIMTFWNALKAGFSSLGDMIGPQLSATLDTLFATLGKIGAALGLFDAGAEGTGKWASAAEGLIGIIATVASWILSVINFGLQIVGVAAEWGVFGAIAGTIGNIIRIVVSLFTVLGPIGKYVFIAIGAAAFIVLKSVEAIVEGIMILVMGLEAVAEALGLIEGKAKRLGKLSAGGSRAKGTAFEGMQQPGKPIAPPPPGGVPQPEGGFVPPGEEGAVPGEPPPGMQPGQIPGGVPLVPPSHVLPPDNGATTGGQTSGGGNEEVVAAVETVNSTLGSMNKNLSGPITIIVQIDGKKVAEAIKDQVDRQRG